MPVGMAPTTSAAETQTKEDGWKQRSDEKKLRWISTKLASTSGQANSLQERVNFHGKFHRANLRLFDYFITNLTTRGSTWRDSSADWAWADKADLMTRIFGLPDEETLLQLLENESQQSVEIDKTSDICPNCESPSMSPTHICDNDDEWFLIPASKQLPLDQTIWEQYLHNLTICWFTKMLCATVQNKPPTRSSFQCLYLRLLSFWKPIRFVKIKVFAWDRQLDYYRIMAQQSAFMTTQLYST